MGQLPFLSTKHLEYQVGLVLLVLNVYLCPDLILHFLSSDVEQVLVYGGLQAWLQVKNGSIIGHLTCVAAADAHNY